MICSMFYPVFFLFVNHEPFQKKNGSQGETGFDFRALQPDMVDVTCRD